MHGKCNFTVDDYFYNCDMPQHQEAPILILIIMADEKALAEYQQLLTGTNFAFEYASSAAEGLEKAASLLPGLVILDVDVERLNTFQTARRIRAIKALTDVTLIMACAPGDRDSRALGLSAGADDFIDKPCDEVELLARLKTLTRLNAQRYIASELKRFSWMTENSPEGYLILDMAGNIHYANERAGELLHLPEDHFGLPFTHIAEQLYTPKPADTWQNWLDEPEPCYLIQPESPTARATWLVVEALDTPMGASHERLVRLRDVTERMTLFQDMRRFHTVVAHKLRTPASIMHTSLAIMNKKLDDLPEAEIKQFARETIPSAFRLVEDIRKILLYLDAPLTLNFGDSLRMAEIPRIVEQVRKTLRIKTVQFNTIANLSDERLNLTAHALEIMLMEIFENAQKFHPQRNPTIEISIWRKEPGYLRLRIADNGQHLSTEQLRWVWLPYFQGEKDFTGELPGVGLGFPLVATLVWKAGGTVRLYNRPNEPGIIVELKLPHEETMRQAQRITQPNLDE